MFDQAHLSSVFEDVKRILLVLSIFYFLKCYLWVEYVLTDLLTVLLWGSSFKWPIPVTQWKAHVIGFLLLAHGSCAVGRYGGFGINLSFFFELLASFHMGVLFSAWWARFVEQFKTGAPNFLSIYTFLILYLLLDLSTYGDYTSPWCYLSLPALFIIITEYIPFLSDPDPLSFNQNKIAELRGKAEEVRGKLSHLRDTVSAFNLFCNTALSVDILTRYKVSKRCEFVNDSLGEWRRKIGEYMERLEGTLKEFKRAGVLPGAELSVVLGWNIYSSVREITHTLLWIELAILIYCFYERIWDLFFI